MIKGSDLLVAALENEGVERVFGVPGEENLDVVESLRNSRIELVLTRHEQAAAFMAATHGRLTGRAGVCLSTLGPGALNLATGAAYAHLGAMPMVLLTGQKAIKTAAQARFQIVDVIASMRPLTKTARTIVSAASIPTHVRDVFRLAEEERPGPVHLELPEDVAGMEVPDTALVPRHPIDLPVASVAALDHAAELILKAKRPLVMIGAGGTMIELLKDAAFAVPPIDAARARTLIDRLTIRRLLDGWRGDPAADIDALALAFARFSALVAALGSDLAEIDVNPLFVRPAGQGVTAADALVVLRHP